MLLYPAKLKIIQDGMTQFFNRPEDAWDWLEVRGEEWTTKRTGRTAPDRTQRKRRHGRSGSQQAEGRRMTRSSSRVVVRVDGTLGVESQRTEIEAARPLVEAVTSSETGNSELDLVEETPEVALE